MEQEQKHDQAKRLMKHAYDGDVTAFKKDYAVFQKQRIVAKVAETKQEMIDALSTSLGSKNQPEVKKDAE